MKLKYYIVTLFLCSYATFIFANGEKIGGIYYILDEKKHTATVTYTGKNYYNKNTYSGDVTIPEIVTYKKQSYSVIAIGEHAFDDCSNLISVALPNSVKSIGFFAFNSCENLSKPVYNDYIFARLPTSYQGKYSIPKGIRIIANYAFWACRVSTIVIPNTVTKIGKDAFSCSRLSSVTIPSSVKNIEETPFKNCYNLTSITVDYNNPTFDSRNNCNAIIKTASNSMVVACKNTIIPEGVTSIGVGAFEGCNITSINLPHSLKSIGTRAFSHTKLTSVVFPEELRYIGFESFSWCTQLISVTIPNSVKEMWKNSYGNPFSNCENLREVRYEKGFNLDLLQEDIPRSICHAIEPQERKTPLSSPADNSTETKQVQPPLLALVNGSIIFSDSSKNNRIDANEQCSINFKIKNTGKGTADNCEARVTLYGTSNGLSVQTVKLPSIGVWQTQDISIPIISDGNVQNGRVKIAIEIYEPQGWGIAPFDLTVATKAFDAPYLQVVDHNTISSSADKIIKKMVPFVLYFNVQNTKAGSAENVRVNVKLPSNVYVMDGSTELSFPTVKSGEVIPIKLTLAANNNYKEAEIPITVDIKEKYGKYAESKTVTVALNAGNSSRVDITEKVDPIPKDIQLAMLTSDVDRNIPSAPNKTINTVALIIANENYQNMPHVPYALNDGRVFREYCIKTLGIPEDKILYVPNGTGNQIKRQITLLCDLAKAIGSEARVILYYTGHGVPDINTQNAFLMPIDGYEEDVTTGYKLDDLYHQLGQLSVNRITVFIDACFSGVNRNDNALAQNKGARLVAKGGMPVGNMLVFSASQGNQTAFVNDNEKHGMFTYHLLKKLKETRGDISMEELAKYLEKEVNLSSLSLKRKKQEPQITPSSQVQNQWQSWKLK